MNTVLGRPERQVNLRVSWETYESLLADHENNSCIRFTYDQGELEILVPSPEHELATSLIEALVEMAADAVGRDFLRTRCTTFRREDLEKGFEPDSSFYFENAKRVRGKKRLDLTRDPAPELIVEIDVTESSMNKMRIYSAIGVPEVWRYVDDMLKIFVLEAEGYVERAHGLAFPKTSAADLTILISAGLELERPEWIKRVRDWISTLSG